MVVKDYFEAVLDELWREFPKEGFVSRSTVKGYMEGVYTTGYNEGIKSVSKEKVGIVTTGKLFEGVGKLMDAVDKELEDRKVDPNGNIDYDWGTRSK